MLYNSRTSEPPQVRTRCRNPRCGGKLKKPAENPRDAFCCRTCEARFYSRRCRVCEALFSPKTVRKQVCQRSRCKHELARNPELYFGLRYPRDLGHNAPKPGSGSISAKLGSNGLANPIKIGVQSGAKSGRGWRVIAGPADLHPLNLQIDPTDPKIAASNAANARFWRQARQAAEREALFQRDTPPLNVIGGFKFPDAPEIDWHPASSPRDRSAEPLIGDGLEIPPFLDRKLWNRGAS